ncbi:hypothetical protein [Hymenobacter elongatus]|uniref:hypothetical protein n=1 Tax=Hymenobacter elongatus TaxID=877208 RepID=UPI001436A0C7|nr:hypothetical protein [Hymenobacter elongatus]
MPIGPNNEANQHRALLLLLQKALWPLDGVSDVAQAPGAATQDVRGPRQPLEKPFLAHPDQITGCIFFDKVNPTRVVIKLQLQQFGFLIGVKAPLAYSFTSVVGSALLQAAIGGTELVYF